MRGRAWGVAALAVGGAVSSVLGLAGCGHSSARQVMPRPAEQVILSEAYLRPYRYAETSGDAKRVESRSAYLVRKDAENGMPKDESEFVNFHFNVLEVTPAGGRSPLRLISIGDEPLIGGSFESIRYVLDNDGTITENELAAMATGRDMSGYQAGHEYRGIGGVIVAVTPTGQ